jgi:hypothetical protein
MNRWAYSMVRGRTVERTRPGYCVGCGKAFPVVIALMAATLVSGQTSSSKAPGKDPGGTLLIVPRFSERLVRAQITARGEHS